MTGKYPARLQLTDWLPGRREFSFQKLQNAKILQQLPLPEVTIAEALKKHGYRTAHIGKWHLGEEPFGPLQQGFDIQIPRWNKGWPKRGYHAPFQLDGLPATPGAYLTDRLTDEAEKFIESNKDQPFFLYLSHFAVHDPIQGRRDLVDKYRNKLQQRAPSTEVPYILEGNPTPGGRCPEKTLPPVCRILPGLIFASCQNAPSKSNNTCRMFGYGRKQCANCTLPEKRFVKISCEPNEEGYVKTLRLVTLTPHHP